MAQQRKSVMHIPPAHVSYFCKSCEVKPVKNEWARRRFKLAESCYQNIEKIFPDRNKTIDGQK